MYRKCFLHRLSDDRFNHYKRNQKPNNTIVLNI